MAESSETVKQGEPKLLDRVRLAARAKFGREEPGDRYADWIVRFVLFHGKRHPIELFEVDIGKFFAHVSHANKDPLRALEQAWEALRFLYDEVLRIPRGETPIPVPPRLLDRVQHTVRLKHFSPRTEQCYVEWAERFIRFHGMRHPRDVGVAEIEMFLTDLAVKGHVSASTQNQAFFALLFLYQQVLGIELPRLDAVRAKRPKRLPTVLAAEEVARLLAAVEGAEGTFRLMARLLYGAGLRREECCRLRVHDLDFRRDQIAIRHGKGGKDRIVMMPRSAKEELMRHVEWRRRLHERDLAAGYGRVALPDALARKFPKAALEFGWQFVFASRQRSRDPRTGDVGRHHVDPGSIARAVARAGRAAKVDRRKC